MAPQPPPSSMEDLGIAIASFLVEIHTSSPCTATALPKSAVSCTEAWLKKSGISYRELPFSPALGKLALFQKNHSVNVEICLVPSKANLLFAQVFLTRNIFSSIAPRCIVNGSEAARFVVAHFETADLQNLKIREDGHLKELLSSFTPPWAQSKPPVRLRLALNRSGMNISCKLRIKPLARNTRTAATCPSRNSAPAGNHSEKIEDAAMIAVTTNSTAHLPSVTPRNAKVPPTAQLEDSSVHSPDTGRSCKEISPPCGDVQMTPSNNCQNTVRNGEPISPSPVKSHGLQAGMCGFIGCAECDAKMASGGVDREQFRLDTVLDDCAAKCGVENENVVQENHDVNVVRNPTFGPNDQLSTLFNDDIHKQIISFLEPEDIAALGCVNRTFASHVKHFVPGLKLHLFAHQRVALDRMRFMERAKRPDLTLPMVRPLKEFKGGAKVVADLFDGAIYFVWRVPTTTVPRGGLICDEPGLGKTITGLSLILKTLKQRAGPPTGAHAQTTTRVVNGDEKEFKCYNDAQISKSWTNADSDFGRNISRRNRILYSQAMTPDADNDSGDYSASLARTMLEEDTQSVSSRLRKKRTHARIETPGSNILLSTASLVVAPRQVVQHWQNQIKEHIAHSSLRLFVARDLKKIPSAESMANDYDIILISSKVLGSMYYALENHPEIPQPLLQVRFLRILFDEGHKIAAGTNFHGACLMLKAERRWIMTGTPTPSTSNSDCRHLHPMLHFLREPTYGLDSETWMNAIQKPYESFKTESLDRLKVLLRRIMIRTNKASIPSIPKLVTKNILLDFSVDSAKSYNELVKSVARNLMTSDWFDETHAQSFLNPKQGKYCRLVLRNLRYAACFGGLFNMDVSSTDLVNTLETLYAKKCFESILEEKRDKSGNAGPYANSALGKINRGDRWVRLTENATGQSLRVTMLTPKEYLSDPEFPVIQESPTPVLSAAQRRDFPEVLRPWSKNTKLSLEMHYRGHLKKVAQAFIYGGICDRCNAHTRQPVVTPCAHVLCTICILSNVQGCPLESCKIPYRMDNNDVPEELIELQPSMMSSGWAKDWDASVSSKIRYLKKRLDKIGWCFTAGLKRRRQKVIIFSQFTDHLMLVSLNLKESPFANNYAELYPNSKDISAPRNKDKHFDQELERFRKNDDCFILLMGEQRGAVGLDLSFVHNIILMEPIWDGSVEKQVVARAHRMGCKETVHVERLVMKDSIEHDMMKVEEEETSEKKSGVGKVKNQYELAKRRRLLLGLRTVVPGLSNHGNAYSNSNESDNEGEMDMDIGMGNTTTPSRSTKKEEDLSKTPLLRAYTRRMRRRKILSSSSSPGSPVTPEVTMSDGDDGGAEKVNEVNGIAPAPTTTTCVGSAKVVATPATPAICAVTDAKRKHDDVAGDGDGDGEKRAVKRRLSYSAAAE